MKPRPEGPRKYRSDRTGSRKPCENCPVAVKPPKEPAVSATEPETAPFDVDRSPKYPPSLTVVTLS